MNILEAIWARIRWVGEQIWEGLQWLGRKIRDLLTVIWEFVSYWFIYCSGLLRSGLWAVAMFFWNWLILPCWTVIKSAYFGLCEFFRYCYEAAKSAIFTVYEAFTNFVYSLLGAWWSCYEIVSNLASRCYQTIMGVWWSFYDSVSQSLSNLREIMARRRRETMKMLSDIMDSVVTTIRNLPTTISEIYESAKNALFDLLRKWSLMDPINNDTDPVMAN